jgi:hypothetical protein
MNDRPPVEIGRRLVSRQLEKLSRRPVQLDDATAHIDSPDRQFDRIDQRPAPEQA